MSKRISSKQISKLVVDPGHGNGEHPQKAQGQEKRGGRDRKNGKILSFRQTDAESLYDSKKIVTQSRDAPRHDEANGKNRVRDDFPVT
jgi:hypothetical protein